MSDWLNRYMGVESIIRRPKTADRENYETNPPKNRRFQDLRLCRKRRSQTAAIGLAVLFAERSHSYLPTLMGFLVHPGQIGNLRNEPMSFKGLNTPFSGVREGKKRGASRASVFPNSFLLKKSPSVNWAALIWTL